MPFCATLIESRVFETAGPLVTKHVVEPLDLHSQAQTMRHIPKSFRRVLLEACGSATGGGTLERPICYVRPRSVSSRSLG